MRLFALSLHYLFYESPKLALEAKNRFPNFQSWKENTDSFCNEKNYTLEQKTRVKNFNLTFSPEVVVANLKAKQIEFVTIDDSHYPKLLRHIPDPPLVLFYRGDIALASDPNLGVVGPRKCSDYAKQACQQLCRSLSHSFVIISGLAAGIDTIAHQTALEENRPTIAVMGTSMDTIYPSSNRELFQKICDTGLVITEYPTGIHGQQHHFARRNRIISGISKGILIIEAGQKSGSLITAKHAMEQNRDIFAVPGSIFSDNSEGVHRLIQDGAKLVHSAEDVTNEFYDISPVLPIQEMLVSLPTNLNDEQQLIWDALNATPQGMDELAEKTGLAIHKLLQHLTYLEVHNWVETLPGNRVKRQG